MYKTSLPVFFFHRIDHIFASEECSLSFLLPKHQHNSKYSWMKNLPEIGLRLHTRLRNISKGIGGVLKWFLFDTLVQN